jgi:hypothetical protein
VTARLQGSFFGEGAPICHLNLDTQFPKNMMLSIKIKLLLRIRSRSPNIQVNALCNEYDTYLRSNSGYQHLKKFCL